MSGAGSLDGLLAGLSDAFAAAPRPARIDACGCGNCGWSEETARLLSTPRESLGAAELGRFTASLLNTVGGPAELRYFAPRILELSIGGDMSFPDLELVFLKLARAGWEQWPEAAFLSQLFDALWAETLGEDGPGTAGTVLCALGAAERSVAGRLARWSRMESAESAERLCEFVLAETAVRRSGRVEPVNAFWDRRGVPFGEVVEWLNGGEALSALGRAGELHWDGPGLGRIVAAYEVLGAVV